MEGQHFGHLDDLLFTVSRQGASDLHLVSGSVPQIRIDGRLRQLVGEPLTGADIEAICYSILTDAEKSRLEEQRELDFAIKRENIGRFRANYYYTLSSGGTENNKSELAAAFRIIPEHIPSLDDLNCPAIFKELIKREKGLILVTGPTGSGKSTTLAAMLNEINITERKHIITVEEPVEFLHEHKKSLFSQRNVGTDTKSFANALRSALREDPDIILIGEMRDPETISIALTAAETGHLVFGTLHTNSAIQTVTRIIESYPQEMQAQVQVMLSNSLAAVISQALLPKKESGRLAVHEILVSNPAIANLIRENKINQIYSQMQVNQLSTNMQTQTQGLVNAIRAGLIDKETAIRYSTNLQELKGALGIVG